MQIHPKGTGGHPRTIEVRAGDRYGAWTVIAEAPFVDNKRRVRCRCMCGQEGVIALTALRNGRSLRCTWCASNRGRQPTA